ncbi:hypothetical protein E2C01_000348 [Portunus trituberculatus]|uniref:Uncharacterized protein n=1 Tax=Portunus trituberculatus TaxID=210409 RepID=A0A5B7CG89_PORTR|nr:hypothetical protein [Portunus trituberculatus]
MAGGEGPWKCTPTSKAQGDNEAQQDHYGISSRLPRAPSSPAGVCEVCMGEPLPRVRKPPAYTQTVDRIRTRALGDPSDPKVRMVPVYHGGSNYKVELDTAQLEWRDICFSGCDA